MLSISVELRHSLPRGLFPVTRGTEIHKERRGDVLNAERQRGSYLTYAEWFPPQGRGSAADLYTLVFRLLDVKC